MTVRDIAMTDGASRVLTAVDMDDLACGAAFLGAGGGGDPGTMLLAVKAELGRGKTIVLCSVDRFADDALLVPCGWIGAPTVSAEKMPNGNEAILGLRKMEQLKGRAADAVLPIEIGGANGLAPLLLAARLGLPVADCDGMGRAFPESQMVTFNFHGVSANPAILTDAKGNVVTLESADNVTHEQLARSVAVTLGGLSHMVEYPLTGRQAKDFGVRGSVTLAIAVGREIRLAKASNVDPFAALAVMFAACPNYGAGGVLFDGKIINLERETRGGFVFGRVDMQELDGSRRLEMLFQNENLIARIDGNVIAMAPDIITVMDRETGDSITTERLRYGQRVKLFGVGAPAALRTPTALAIVGPDAFALGTAWQSIESLNGWGGAR